MNEQFATGCQHKKFNIYLKVPQTPPTDTETSKLIKIEYFVQVSVFFFKFQLIMLFNWLISLDFGLYGIQSEKFSNYSTDHNWN